ncbi:hypothetical protein GYMLUDRAFT_36666 [Collybiopsis luxurians FD-317 M1]|nr:hypothetical protein GYMLUDRAFT_36666 [Collybiopsis luxurians FD-317 M1]
MNAVDGAVFYIFFILLTGNGKSSIRLAEFARDFYAELRTASIISCYVRPAVYALAPLSQQFLRTPTCSATICQSSRTV